MPRRRDFPPGIRQTPTGYQAYVKIAGHMRSKRFPPGEPLATMTGWRKDRQAMARLGVTPPEQTLAADIDRYFETILTMHTLDERRLHLAWWKRRLGTRARAQITSRDIREALETLRASGKAPSTCNHYRSALSHLWTVLDGR